MVLVPGVGWEGGLSGSTPGDEILKYLNPRKLLLRHRHQFHASLHNEGSNISILECSEISNLVLYMMSKQDRDVSGLAK
jgi:hypothetical protein